MLQAVTERYMYKSFKPPAVGQVTSNWFDERCVRVCNGLGSGGVPSWMC